MAYQIKSSDRHLKENHVFQEKEEEEEGDGIIPTIQLTVHTQRHYWRDTHTLPEPHCLHHSGREREREREREGGREGVIGTKLLIFHSTMINDLLKSALQSP